MLRRSDVVSPGGGFAPTTRTLGSTATNKNLADEIRRALREAIFCRSRFSDSTSRSCGSAPTHPLLSEHFLRQASVRFGRKPKSLSSDAVDALQAWGWPGNVRELKNLIERLMILSPADEVRRADLPAGIGGSDVPEGLAPDAPLRDAREDFERRYILAALRKYRGNVSRTAEALDLERSNLYRKLKAYGIEVERE